MSTSSFNFNQPISNVESKAQIYSQLKSVHAEILDSDPIWNWNSLVTLTKPSLARILTLEKIYLSMISVSGDIFEFGCHYGASTNILHNLRRIYEPNRFRPIHTFDTFQGFPSVTPSKDVSSTSYLNKESDFSKD